MSSQTTEIKIRLITNLTQICRLCLSEESLEDIFEQEDLNIWISNFLSIVVSKEDIISRSICTSCRSRLHEFREYQLRCLKVQNVLLDESTAVKEECLSLIESKEAQQTPQEDPKQTSDVQEETQRTDSGAKENGKESRRFRHYKWGESGRKKHIFVKRAIFINRLVKRTTCGKKGIESSMEGHQNKHQDLQSFKCERGCENVDFKCQQRRNYHYRSVHDGQQHECHICHKSFRTKSTLSLHIKGVHASKTYVCPVCGKAFTTSTRLKVHSKFHSVHERKHHCSVCCLSFFTKYNLKMHMKTHSRRSQEKDLANAEKTQIDTVADPELPEDAPTSIQEYWLEEKVVKIEPGADPDPEQTIDVKDDFQPTDHVKVLCPICDKIIKKVRLEGHQNWHEGVRPFKCELGCENVDFHCKLKRQQHYGEVHNRHECDICHNIYRSKKYLTAHKESVHVPKRFECSACSRTFTTATRLKKHIRFTHNRERNHPCPKCNKLFCYKSEVATHLKIHEKAEEKMRAEADSEQLQDVLLGDSSTAMEEDLFEAEEVKIEPESDTEQPIDVQPTVEKVKCFKCGKQIHESDKEAHRNWHLGLRPYKCELGCENSDFRSDQLRMVHYEQVHERHECDICHDVYQSKKTLRDHKRCVHVPKPFECSACSLAFTTTTRLKNHIRFTHNRERNHPCPKCNKLFGFKYEVARHQKRHERVEEKMRANRSTLMKDLVKTEPETDSEKVQDVLRSSTAMEEDLFEAEETKIEPESDSEHPTDVRPTIKKEEQLAYGSACELPEQSHAYLATASSSEDDFNQKIEPNPTSPTNEPITPTNKPSVSSKTSASTSAQLASSSKPAGLACTLRPMETPKATKKMYVSITQSDTYQQKLASDEQKENETNSTHELTPDKLLAILQKSPVGRDIIRLAGEGVLSERRQLELAEFVAQWHVSNKSKRFEHDLKKYATTIVTLFQNEKLESYFLPIGGDKKNPGGKIYNKINTLKAKARKRRLDDEQHNKTSELKHKQDSKKYDEAVLDALQWLQVNEAPWTTVLDRWKTSYPTRAMFLTTPSAVKELSKLNLWRLISSNFGYQLICIDYQLLHPNSNTQKATEWSHILTVAGSYIKRRSVDESSSRLIDTLNNTSIPEDTRLCVLLLLLNCVLHPLKVTKDYKPTVLNGQDDTIIFVESDAEADAKLADLYKRYQDLAIPLAPKLVFFGKPTELLGTFRVYYDSTYYTLTSVSHAIDVYIKQTVVLGLKHSKISKLVWVFIAQYIYKLTTSERYASIDKFKEYLEASKA